MAIGHLYQYMKSKFLRISRTVNDPLTNFPMNIIEHGYSFLTFSEAAGRNTSQGFKPPQVLNSLRPSRSDQPGINVFTSKHNWTTLVKTPGSNGQNDQDYTAFGPQKNTIFCAGFLVDDITFNNILDITTNVRA